MSLLIAKADREVRKVYVDGLSTGEKINPYYFEPVRAYTNEQTSLEVIANEIRVIEAKDLNCCLLPNLPRYTEKGGQFRRTIEMLQNEPRNWFQADLDWKVSGMNFNQFSLDERVEYALRALPFLSCQHRQSVASSGVVAHLSNKAGVEAYKEYIGLRLYFILSEPLDAKEMRKLFSPWHGTVRQGTVDTSLAHFNAIHLVRAPKLINTERRLEETLKVYEGLPLDVKALREHPDSNKRKQQETKFVKASHYGFLSEEDKQDIIDLAKEGFFEGQRNTQHFKMIASYIYTKQDAAPIIRLIAETPEILGERRTLEDLKKQEEAIHKRNKEEYIPDLWNQTDIYKHDELDCLDVNDATLDGLFNRLSNYERSVIVCKSPHGSGKTNALVPRLEKYIRERYGKTDIRTLYICSLRSVIRQSCSNLMMACYITPQGTIDEVTIAEEDRIGICIKSLQRVEGNAPYDLVIIDESEQVGTWAQWDNANHNRLIDICKQAKAVLFMDADASDLSMYMAREVSQEGQHDLQLLLNRKSYIASQKAHLLQYEVDFYGKILDLLDEGKRIWINVDFDDKPSNPRITALVKLIEAKYGKGTALGYDAKTTQAPPELFESPDAFIENAFKNDVRAIITSPVISVGWRYKGLPRFDATVSNYSLGLNSAPAIIQQLERCVAVNNHYLYIANNPTYLDLDVLEAKYRNEYFEKNDTDISEKIVFRDDFRERLKILATKRKTLEDNNIRLHFYYLWNEYGGSIVELSSIYQDDEDALQALKEYKEIKKAELDRRCKQLYQDPKTRGAFFYNYKMRTKDNQFSHINDIDIQTIPYEKFHQLFKKHDKLRISQPEITEFVHLLTSTSAEHTSWTFFAPWWLNDSDTPDSEKKNEKFYVPLGELIHRVMNLVLKTDAIDSEVIREKVLFGNEQIVLHAKQLHDESLNLLKRKWGDCFSTRLRYYRKGMSNVALVKHILTDILCLKVKTHQGELEHSNRYENWGLPKVKQELVKAYMDIGRIKKSKNLKVNENIARIERWITQKELDGEELSELEIAYLERSNFLIIATREDFIPSSLYSLLESNTHTGLFERNR